MRCMSVWCVCMGECVVYGCEWGMYGMCCEWNVCMCVVYCVSVWVCMGV